jgi:ABC-type glycerol-3-phosphate transport system substrate-binding protein
MYKILDWIAIHKKLAIILTVFIIFLVITLLFLFLSNKDRQLTVVRGLPLQGGSTEFKMSWWVSNTDGSDLDALAEVVSKFRDKYTGTEIQIVNKKDDLEFIEEFLSNPDSQPELMTINSKNMAFYQKYSASNQYFQKELLADYLERSVDTVKNNNIYSGEIYGVPLHVDNLQMYVNKNLLNNLSSSKTVAKDWETLKLQASSFDKTKGQNLISLGGSKDTVKNFEDIIGAMMVQKSIYLDSKNKEITDTDFIQVLKDYNYFKQFLTRTDNDYDSFKQGKSLYYIDYYSANDKLKVENPSLDFEITDIPKYSNGNNISHSKFFTTMAHKKNSLEPEKKRIVDDFIYYLSLEETQKIYSEKTKYPSANKKVASEQYKSKSDLDNNRRFFDQALVARAILPSCPVKYTDVLTTIISSIQSKGTNVSSEEYNNILTANKSNLLSSVFTQNVCLPYKFQE